MLPIPVMTDSFLDGAHTITVRICLQIIIIVLVSKISNNKK